MTYFDALVTCGNPFMKRGTPVSDIADALRADGIDRAVVLTEDQRYKAPDDSAIAIPETLAPYPNLYGLYPMVSGETGEVPEAEWLLANDFPVKFAGVYLETEPFNIPRRPVFLRDWLDACEKRRVPIWFSASGTSGYEYVADLLESHPRLIFVLTTEDEWPVSRKLIPLARAYRGVHICLADLIFMDAIEDFVQRASAEQILFSTRFPKKFTGAAKLGLQNARISDADKEKIARLNLEALLGGVKRG